MDTDQRFEQHGLAATRLTDNHVHLAVLKRSTDMIQHRDAVLKRLNYVYSLNHSSNRDSTRSNSRMMMLEFTTAFVEALPTSSAPP